MKMATSYKKLKKGQIIGLKKAIRLKYKHGKNEYWEVECLKCGQHSVLHIGTVWKGEHCNACRRREIVYLNTFQLGRHKAAV